MYQRSTFLKQVFNNVLLKSWKWPYRSKSNLNQLLHRQHLDNEEEPDEEEEFLKWKQPLPTVPEAIIEHVAYLCS